MWVALNNKVNHGIAEVTHPIKNNDGVVVVRRIFIGHGILQELLELKTIKVSIPINNDRGLSMLKNYPVGMNRTVVPKEIPLVVLNFHPRILDQCRYLSS